METTKPRLKDRLARLFRPATLLRSSAAVSSRSNSAAISSRSFSGAASTRSFSLAPDIAQEPLYIPRKHRSEAEEVNLSLLRRSLSLDHQRSRRNFVGCGGCRPNSAAIKKESESKVRESRGFDEFVERGGEGDGRTCPPASPKNDVQLYYYCFKDEELEKKRKIMKKKKKMVKRKQRTRSNRNQLSISSSFGEEGFGFFSSEEAETTFFSTRSFSSDSSEFYSRPLSKTRKTSRKTEQINKKKKQQQQPRRLASKSRDVFNNGFQPLVSVSFSEEDEVVEKTRHGGFPVLKKSNDPYSDFRSSMAEMIVERQIFGTSQLERLLHSYLSLNSVDNHPAILRAFFDISQVLFSY